ncbi:MAG: MBL fold metallo-hydrolase [bacterium]
MALTICTFMVSPFQQNARVVADFDTKQAMVIDPGDEIPRILDWVCEHDLRLETLFLTHCHIDHAGGVKALLEQVSERGMSEPTLYYHRDDKMIADNIEPYALMCGLSAEQYRNVPEPTAFLDVTEPFLFAGRSLELRFVPGHSPGHVVLFIADEEVTFEGDFVTEKVVFGPLLIAGDTLFRGSIGRSDLPGGDGELLLASIRSQLFTLPDQTLVLSGHGPNTSIGREKQHNPFLR